MKKFSWVLILLVVVSLISCPSPSSSSKAWVVSTIAGSTQGFSDSADGTPQFDRPSGVAVDSEGNLYVADTSNHRIRKITPAGAVSTLAGSDQAGTANGQGTSAQFNRPSGVATDSAGNLYVADQENNRIRKIVLATKEVSVIADSSTSGTANGQGTSAQFSDPSGVAVDAAGNVYVADTTNNWIRKLALNAEKTSYTVSTFSTGFSWPLGVAVDSAGNLYVADTLNNQIRKITDAGVVSTLAGDDTSGHRDGAGDQARFNRPSGVAVDSSGNVYVADYGNHRIRKIVLATKEVSTIAGSDRTLDETITHRDGAGDQARFDRPSGVAVDSSGNVYVADYGNNRIRKIVYQ